MVAEWSLVVLENVGYLVGELMLPLS